MVGISSYAGYVPHYQLNRMMVYGAMGWFNPVTIMNAGGEKAVANFDEDSITMAVAAGAKCLNDYDPTELGAVYFASTTAPFKERQNANIVAGALCAGDEIRTADFSGSLKAGTAALLSALEFVASNSGNSAIACAADCRLGKVGSVQEMIFGDGSASILISNSDVIAEFKGSYSLAYDFVDHLRGANSKFDRQWEERWIRDIGYNRFIPEVVEGLCRKYNLKPGDFSRVIYPCYYGGARRSINKKLGLEAVQVQDELLTEVGDTGAAHPLLMLSKTLEDAEPGDKLLLVGYGNGCDALFFQVTDNITRFDNRKRLSDSLNNRVDLDNYLKYLVWRDMVPAEVGMRGEEDQLTRLSLIWRNHRAILSLQGNRCLKCGTQQFPPQRICVNPACGVTDEMDTVYLANKGGTIFSYTSDMLSASINPPAIYGTVDFNGGGRCMMDFTDCTFEDLKVGKSVNFSFRVKYYDSKRDTTFYFWKAVPVS